MDVIKRDCSLTSEDWFTFDILFHPENKQPIDVLRAMSLPEICDYREALEALSMIKDAGRKDQEAEARLQQRGK